MRVNPLPLISRHITTIVVTLTGLISPLWISAAEQGSQPAVSGVDSFLEQHWSRPLASQGAPPKGFNALERSLQPQECGVCHPKQYEEWSTTLHSKAMGPGLMGQLLDMEPDATDEHQACLRCHAPLKEQAESLTAALWAGRRSAAISPHKAQTKPRIHEQGMVCAACHMRNYRLYGPKRLNGTTPEKEERLPHEGWVTATAFEDSRFCAACHQFEADEYALNGKLLENTYEEWRGSRYALEGRSCQSCHMPGRRHLWRGIHDPDMVKQGVEFRPGEPAIESGIIKGSLLLANTGTGHYFPTYVTPKVTVEAYQEDADGEMLTATKESWIVARQVTLDLSEEVADTRIPPDGEQRFEYSKRLAPEAVTLVFRARVEPDAFYTSFYRALLEGGFTNRGTALIRKALDDSLKSEFLFYTNRQPLPK